MKQAPLGHFQKMQWKQNGVAILSLVIRDLLTIKIGKQLGKKCARDVQKIS